MSPPRNQRRLQNRLLEGPAPVLLFGPSATLRIRRPCPPFASFELPAGSIATLAPDMADRSSRERTGCTIPSRHADLDSRTSAPSSRKPTPRTTNGQPGYSCLTNSWHSSSSHQRPHTMAAGDDDPLALYYNGNGRITCAEARRHGIAPVHSDHPAYAFMRDGDGDGVVCE